MKIRGMICTICIFLMVTTVSVSGVEANQKKASPYLELQQVVDLQEGPVLVIENTSNALFWEFQNFDSAILTINRLDNVVLSEIRDEFNFEVLSKENWNNYKTVFFDKHEKEVVLNQRIDLQRLYQFFTVCENMEINRIAIDMYNSNDYEIEILSTFLPYTSPLIEKTKSANSKSRVASSVNKTSMINYAKQYAVRNNSAYINYENSSNGDCANFASQILRAGGMPTDRTWSLYSNAWGGAHNFALYWYSRSSSQNSTIYYSTFVNDARAGDFIAQDFQNDGRWDHIGFIVGGSGYNLIIAQHSDNYYGNISGRPGWKNNVKKWTRIRFAY